MTLLHEPQTPLLLRLSTSTAVNLVLRTTQEGSEERYVRLCGLLGDCIIGSAWMYASRELDTVEATIEVLPEIINALGVGAVRYLKVRTVSSERISVLHVGRSCYHTTLYRRSYHNCATPCRPIQIGNPRHNSSSAPSALSRA